MIDRNESYAISMLSETIQVPAWLTNLTKEESTVYHIGSLTSKQARKLWDAGFRDFAQFNNRGLSPLISYESFRPPEERIWLEKVAWLIEKGADIHRQQRLAFHRGKETRFAGKNRVNMTNEYSSTTALHNVARVWAPTYIGRLPWPEDVLSEATQQFLKILFYDDLSDSCICVCSTTGCKCFTMFAKTLIKRTRIDFPRARELLVYLLRALAQYIDVDQPNYAWLRHELIRFPPWSGSICLIHVAIRITCANGKVYW